MSSPLSAMTCLRVDGRTCWIRIEPMQALTLPYSDAFALETLLEVYGGVVRLGEQMLWSWDIVGPLAPALEGETGLSRLEVMSALADNPGAMEALVARYVSFRGYRDVAGFTVPAAFRPDADGLYVPKHWWTTDRERDEAHALLSEELEAWYVQHYAHEEEGGPPPTLTEPAITMVIEATRPEWLAHMRPGMGWDGYSFDSAAPAFP
jgi:hypothetical protein